MSVIELPSIVAPEPGIYPDVPSDVYHKWNLCSNSALSKLNKTPLHLRYWLDNPEDEKSDALRIGEAVHFATLQPDVFQQRYCTIPKIDKRTNEGKARYAEECKKNEGKIILAQDEWDKCQAMARSVWNHLSAGSLVKGQIETEVSAVWDDAETGTRCKLRSDLLNPSFEAIVDLKTTTDAGLDAFEKSIFTYGYARQAAMYLDGWSAMGRKFENFILVAVEKEPPYAVAVYRLMDDVIDLARKELRMLLQSYKKCIATNKWPGYSEQIQDIALPTWAIKQMSQNL